MIGLAVPENISNTTQGSNAGTLAIRVDLPAQSVDVDVHHIGIRLNSHTPDFIENHRPCDDAACIPAQVL